MLFDISKQTNRTQTKMNKIQEQTCYSKINGKDYHLKTVNFRLDYKFIVIEVVKYFHKRPIQYSGSLVRSF